MLEFTLVIAGAVLGYLWGRIDGRQALRRSAEAELKRQGISVADVS